MWLVSFYFCFTLIKVKCKGPHGARGYCVGPCRWAFLGLRCFSWWHPIKNLLFSYIIWEWARSQQQKIQLAVTRPIRQCSYHRNRRTEASVAVQGWAAVQWWRRTPGSFSFCALPPSPSCHVTAELLHLQALCPSYGQKERDRREMMTKSSVSQVCLWGKPKACSKDPSSKLPLVSCGLGPRHKVTPKGREEQKVFGRARGRSAQNQCLIVKNVLPISPGSFKSISVTYAHSNLCVNASVLTAGETVKVVCTDL